MSGEVEVEFEPWSRRSLIAGTSYVVQIGKVEGDWAVCIFRGREVIAVKKTGTLDINVLTSIIYSSLATPPSHYAIMRALSNLIREAKVRQMPITAAPPQEQAAPQPPPQQPEVTPHEAAGTIEEPHPPAPRAEAEVKEPKGTVSKSVQDFFKVSELTVKEEPAPPREEVEPVKELTIQDMPFPEKWEKTVSSLMLLWGIAVSFITEKAKKRADELWGYYRSLIRESWSKVKETDFKELIKLFISQCRLMGASVKVEKLTENTFESSVECIASKFKEKYKAILNLPPEFPCVICQMRGEEIGKLHGLHVEITNKEDGCKIKVYGPPKRETREPPIII
ncbi:MAG: hypothetical protein KIH01_03565 [Candidatus Freyarchaeota archaeon]|nr:hypothetical protein [Candidatus Jordarchaeia archaeon]